MFLFTHSGDWVCCGVCTSHDWRAVYRLVCVVCVRVLTSVPYGAVYSAELWRFSTSTREWERVDSSTEANGVSPSGRVSHVMTFVGLDLWVHGGLTDSGEGDPVG